MILRIDRNRLVLTIIGFAIAFTSSSAQRYRVIDIGTLPDCDTTFATDVNNAGVVVGYAYKHVPPGHANSRLSRPYVWVIGKITELPGLGGKYGQALTINADGDIGGWSDTADYKSHPVIWQRKNGYKPLMLSKLEGGVGTLTDDGVAFGYIQNEKQERCAFRWDGKIKILGNPKDVESVINKANRDGTAVGISIPQGGSSQSYMSPGDRHAAMWKDGKQVALPEMLNGKIARSTSKKPTMSECCDINDQGVVVGYTGELTRRQACVWEIGKIRVLETTPGCSSRANSINNNGLIVGQAQVPMENKAWKEVACFWQGGKRFDLNELLPSDSGWNLSIADHVNDIGMIVGVGGCDKFPEDKWRAFLLVPVK